MRLATSEGRRKTLNPEPRVSIQARAVIPMHSANETATAAPKVHLHRYEPVAAEGSFLVRTDRQEPMTAAGADCTARLSLEGA
jgi:hypothetical protein